MKNHTTARRDQQSNPQAIEQGKRQPPPRAGGVGALNDQVKVRSPLNYYSRRALEDRFLGILSRHGRYEGSVAGPMAGAEEIVSELIEAVDQVLASTAKEQPIHMTRDIIGPGDTNVFGLSMDFDITVLWIAAWYRRGEVERRELLSALRLSDELVSVLGSVAAVEAWVSEIETALNLAMPENAKNPKPLSLEQISVLIKNWNGDARYLRGSEGDDLLSRIGNRRNTIEYLIMLLADEQGKRTIFTTDDDVSPGWTALNFLRYWTVLGREKRMRPRIYGPRESHEYLRSWMETDPVATE